jgi:hypothetical protein
MHVENCEDGCEEEIISVEPINNAIKVALTAAVKAVILKRDY